MTHIPSYIRSKRAAYKALAAYRITAADRDEIAQRIADTLAELPEDVLPGLINLGLHSGTASRIAWMIQTHMPTCRRHEAAGAAVVAAARAILDPP